MDGGPWEKGEMGGAISTGRRYFFDGHRLSFLDAHIYISLFYFPMNGSWGLYFDAHGFIKRVHYWYGIQLWETLHVNGKHTAEFYVRSAIWQNPILVWCEPGSVTLPSFYFFMFFMSTGLWLLPWRQWFRVTKYALNRSVLRHDIQGFVVIVYNSHVRILWR